MATITPINPNRAMTSYAPTAANSDIDTALAQIKAQMPAYRKYERYYDGDHPLTFATDKFRNAFGSQLREFAYNVCPMVVDALPDRLTVTGFEVEKGTEQNGTAAWEIWQQNRMDQRQGEVYQEASLSGDGYVLVWPSPLDQTLPTIYPQRACHMTVKYDGEIPGLIKWAAKLWISDEGYKRLNLYYADRIERYVSRSASKDNIMPDNASTFVRYVDSMGDADEREEGVAAAIGAGYDQWPIYHPYGQVPVFHFANNARVGAFGRSELHNIIPVQNALNKTYCDMMVDMEFAAFRQRWATGLESEIDEVTGKVIPPFVPGGDRIWSSADKDTKFGEFEAADLTNFLQAADNFQLGIARISGTPLQYMMLMTNPPSGEALKTLEAKFIKKVRDRQATWGNVWENVLHFALRIRGEVGADATRLSAVWEDAAPTSTREQAETMVLLRKGGLGRRQRLERIGLKGKALEEAYAEPDDATPGGFGA